MLLDIAQVARATGMAASRLRYYEDKRLIASVGRRGLKRLFEASVVERLSLIALAQSAGFSLDEIAGLFDEAGRPSLDRARLSAKAGDLDRTIRRLSALRDGLRHAAACPAPSHMECPTFRGLLKGAVRARPGRFVEDLG